MYSGTGVWVGHAHWQSTTLWKYCGLETSVGAVRPLLRAATSPACIAPDPHPSQPSLLLDRDALSQLPALFQSCFFYRSTMGRGVAGSVARPQFSPVNILCSAAKPNPANAWLSQRA